MSARPRSLLACGLALLALLAVLAGAGPAAAQVPDLARPIVDAYERDGAISPCRYSPEALRAASVAAQADPGAFPNGFAGAAEAASEARLRGVCEPQEGAEAAPTGTPAPGATATTTPAPATPAPAPGAATPSPVPTAAGTPTPTLTPGPATATPSPTPAAAAPGPPSGGGGGGGGVPAGAWVLGGLALALALATTALALVARKRRGDEPLAGLGHAWREAGHRAGGAWLDFSDWLRVGR